MARDNGGKGGRVLQNINKGLTDKPRRGIRGGRLGQLGLGGDVGGKCRQLYLNNNKKPLKNYVVPANIPPSKLHLEFSDSEFCQSVRDTNPRELPACSILHL